MNRNFCGYSPKNLPVIFHDSFLNIIIEEIHERDNCKFHSLFPREFYTNLSEFVINPELTGNTILKLLEILCSNRDTIVYANSILNGIYDKFPEEFMEIMVRFGNNLK